MVEVFKTNVEDTQDAAWILEQMDRNFPDCQANFDLEDCDRILRVKSGHGQVDSEGIITLLNSAGYHASILEENPGEPAVL